MAIPQIGAYAFTGWDGIIAVSGPRITLYEQGGINGYGVVFGGLKTDPQQVNTLYRANSAGDASGNIIGYRSLMLSYQPVTVFDQFGFEWDNVLILNVVSKFAVDPIGWIVRAQWTLLLPST